MGVCTILLAWSIGVAPVLGDESYHFRRAVVYFEAPWSNIRAAYDPAFPAEGPCSTRYWDAVLWPMGLAMIWKALGTPSFLVAQAYHLGYMLMLGVFSFLAGREIYGRAGGWWTWALAMTMPINILLSTVFYLEIPVAAMAAMAVYGLLRQRAALFGVALAGMFYVKMPMAAILAPPLLLAAFLMLGNTWRLRVMRTLVALAVAGVLFAPDMLWRSEHFGQPIMFREPLTPLQVQLLLSLPPPERGAICLSLGDPLVVVKTFGVTGIAAILASVIYAVWLVGHTGVALVRRARAVGPVAVVRFLPEGMPSELLVAAIPLLFYVAAFVFLMRLDYDVRYFHGSMLFSTLLAGGLLARAAPFAYQGRRRWLVRGAAVVLILGMIGQLATAPAAIRQRRQLKPAVAAGFAWIKENVPPGSIILYPEFNIVPMTGRPMAWAACVPRYFFNMNTTEAQRMRFLYYLDVRYIGVHPTRFIERAEPAIEPIGFPLEWARSLRTLPYMTQVYPKRPCDVGDPNFVVYRIDRDKIPPEWLAKPLYEGGPSVLQLSPARELKQWESGQPTPADRLVRPPVR